jgi:hypothetical protein
MKAFALLGMLVTLAACGGGGGEGGGAGTTAPDASTDSPAGGGTAAWIGSWTCTSGGTLGGAQLPGTQSTAVISAGPTAGALSVVATTTGSSNPPCTLTATLTSDTQAAFPTGQSCTLKSPVAATLTLTANSTARLQGATVTTTENVVVSGSPGFDGQTGTLTGSCVKQ